VDGPSHFEGGEAEHDAARTEYLENKGWTVIRFSNADVVDDIDAVVEAIWLKAMEIRDGK
jgi:very-short-patch-repair endonuclease